ncbi:hypothetical protein ACIQCX_13535 [Enterobacter cancerogenus]|uniref:hypothetical protein n=1 Tax=Enterobacter cancerogenus TaxID=69218 RepID=UPI00380A4696
MKHTPPPWSVNVIGKHWNNKSLTHIEVTFGQDGECICDTVYNQDDANLIAAAPDLLNALQAMLSKAYKQNWNDQYPDEVSKAQAAISKALGEE